MQTIDLTHDPFPDEFVNVVEEILPALGFEQPDIDALLARQPPGASWDSDDELNALHILETPDGPAYLGALGKPLRSPLFILPGRWQERYSIVEHALRRIMAEPSPYPGHLTIEESTPSLHAYFLGILPRLGLELDCRAGFAMPISAMPRGADIAPDSPGDIVAFSKALYREFCAVYAEAFTEFGYCPTWLPHDVDFWAEEFDGTLDCASPIEGYRYHHLGIQQDGRIVACCDVSLHERMLRVRNVAVLPDYRRRGLATRLFAAHADWARQEIGDDDVIVDLNAHRGWTPSMFFYRSLGFKVQRLFTRALWQPPSVE